MIIFGPSPNLRILASPSRRRPASFSRRRNHDFPMNFQCFCTFLLFDFVVADAFASIYPPRCAGDLWRHILVLFVDISYVLVFLAWRCRRRDRPPCVRACVRASRVRIISKISRASRGRSKIFSFRRAEVGLGAAAFRSFPAFPFGRGAEVGFDFGVSRMFDGIPWRSSGLRNESLRSIRYKGGV